MQAQKYIQELKEERDRILLAIAAIERLAAGSGQKRRGRPPKWMQQAKALQGEE